MKRFISILLCIFIGLFLSAPAQALFTRTFTSLTGDVLGSIDHEECSDLGNSFDDGIGIVITSGAVAYFYYFDRSATDATSSPDYIRCKNYSTSGVWIKADPTGGSGVPAQSDCSGITSGLCLDIDDGILYAWDSDSVEPVPVDSELTALAGLTSAADKLPYFTGPGTASLADFSSYARTLIALANKAALQAELSTDDMQTAIGISEGAQHMGTYTGSTITDNQTAKQNIQELETAAEQRPQFVVADADTDPGVNDDSNSSSTAATPDVSGYSVGDIFLNDTASPNELWICIDNTDGAAVWWRLVLANPNGVQDPSDNPNFTCYHDTDGESVCKFGMADADKNAADGVTRLYGFSNNTLTEFMNHTGSSDGSSDKINFAFPTGIPRPYALVNITSADYTVSGALCYGGVIDAYHTTDNDHNVDLESCGCDSVTIAERGPYLWVNSAGASDSIEIYPGANEAFKFPDTTTLDNGDEIDSPGAWAGERGDYVMLACWNTSNVWVVREIQSIASDGTISNDYDLHGHATAGYWQDGGTTD